MAPGSTFTKAAAIVDAAGKLVESVMRTPAARGQTLLVARLISKFA
jgi:hypothetical protein